MIVFYQGGRARPEHSRALSRPEPSGNKELGLFHADAENDVVRLVKSHDGQEQELPHRSCIRIPSNTQRVSAPTANEQVPPVKVDVIIIARAAEYKVAASTKKRVKAIKNLVVSRQTKIDISLCRIWN